MVDLSKMKVGAFIRLRSGAIRRVCRIEHKECAQKAMREINKFALPEIK